MGTRLELHNILCEMLGSNHVYFQPSTSIQMTYPAIVYELDRVDGQRADDLMYTKNKRYAIKYISRDPENEMIDKMLELPYCAFDRRYKFDNLYHDCFSLYF